MNKDRFIEKYLSHLNDNQMEAVQTVYGPVLLLAVPGSGKTTVLVNRLGYMLCCEGIDPSKILTLTYTIAATVDMEKRFVSIYGENCRNKLEFRTINGICAKIIAKYGQVIGKKPFALVTDEKILTKVLTDILAKVLSEYPTEADVKAARTMITYCKNMMLVPDEIRRLEETAGFELYHVYSEYNAYLKTNSLMDYDDQMIYALKMLQSAPELLKYYQEQYQYICVDEAQDTSKIQHEIIRLLAGMNGNLFMVGDEDQSIYGFRAAYPEALLHFEQDHPGARVLVMNQNYRSNAKIVAAADAFIQKNVSRHPKHMVPTKDKGSDIYFAKLKRRSSQYNYLTKVADKCLRETAVLYRENESVIPLVDLLDRKEIPYRIRNGEFSFFTHRVVLDVLSIMLFALNPNDTELFMKIYYKCSTYLKKSQAETICRISSERQISVLDAMDYYNGMNRMTLKHCRSFRTNMRLLFHEEPSRALFRIANPLGYGDYMERTGLDSNKLFILKMLSYNETTIPDYLKRMEYLHNLLKNHKSDEKCLFILSTIHSSKGLEYNRVYLMDVCDGIFPVKEDHKVMQSAEGEQREFEEERRLFYVGATRAKNDLTVFEIEECYSTFISEFREGQVN